MEYNDQYPSVPAWNRSLKSLVIEWEAHNDVYYLIENENCKHVDLDNHDEETGYWGYWIRAGKGALKNEISY